MTHQPAASHALAGFLPIAFDDLQRVVLRQLGDLPFREAFFGESAAHAGAEAPTTRLSPASLIAVQPDLLPPSLILHVGRCGSTLLCRLLDATGTVATYREPDVVLAATELEGDPSAPVRAVLQQFSWHADAAARSAVIKVASSGTRMLDGLIPNVPRVYLVRDALPVISRVLHDPPVWLQQSLPPEWVASRRAAGESLDPFTQNGGMDQDVLDEMVDVATGRWNDVVAAALEWSGSGGALMIDHAELVADPNATVQQVLSHLTAREPEVGSPGEGLDDQVIAGIMGRHAKSGAVLADPGRPADPSPLDGVWEARVVERVRDRQLQLDEWRRDRSTGVSR